MAACPIISTSRGGALVTVGMAFLAAVILTAAHFVFPAHRQEDSRTRRITMYLLGLFFIGALALGFALGWKALEPRMALLGEGYQHREQDYGRAWPIADDYPLFGTGPGSFESVSQLYRVSTDANWYEQLHNDWLETRITFGWVGSALIALAFATVVLRWFARGGIQGGRRFIMLMWLALGGCLVHARFDFPFQMHSIVFLFLVLCAILFDLSRRPA
jgi:O-antigen ligase